MSELSQALEKAAKQIARYRGKEINEQNTKTALIQTGASALEITRSSGQPHASSS